MHDFTDWAEAAAPMGLEPPAVGWRRGGFTPVYRRSREEASETVIEASVTAQAVLELLEAGSNHWRGEPAELLARLRELMHGVRGLPDLPRALSNELNRIAPERERRRGVRASYGKSNGRRWITPDKRADA